MHLPIKRYWLLACSVSFMSKVNIPRIKQFYTKNFLKFLKAFDTFFNAIFITFHTNQDLSLTYNKQAHAPAFHFGDALSCTATKSVHYYPSGKNCQ